MTSVEVAGAVGGVAERSVFQDTGTDQVVLDGRAVPERAVPSGAVLLEVAGIDGTAPGAAAGAALSVAAGNEGSAGTSVDGDVLTATLGSVAGRSGSTEVLAASSTAGVASAAMTDVSAGALADSAAVLADSGAVTDGPAARGTALVDALGCVASAQAEVLWAGVASTCSAEADADSALAVTEEGSPGAGAAVSSAGAT
jgi:hypothetical protein